MEMRRLSTFRRSSSFTARRSAALAVLAQGSLLAACVSDVDPLATGGVGGMGTANAGTAGASAGGSSGGNNGGGQSGGGPTDPYRSDPTYNTGIVCPSPTQALMTDFAPLGPPVAAGDAGADAGADAASAAPSTGSWGDYTAQFSGSTWSYPVASSTYPVLSDYSGSNWHISGDVGDYSGFGVTFGPSGCSLVDASEFDGISFTIRGSVPSPMGSNVQFNVSTAQNEITHVWLNQNAMPLPNPPAAPNKGRCVPAATQYDNTCGAPRFMVPVTAEETTITILWAQLTGGTPAPTVNPEEITGFNWNFIPPMGAGTASPTPYPADITIDNLSFVNNP
jgi:hypothetical protein